MPMQVQLMSETTARQTTTPLQGKHAGRAFIRTKISRGHHSGPPERSKQNAASHPPTSQSKSLLLTSCQHASECLWAQETPSLASRQAGPRSRPVFTLALTEPPLPLLDALLRSFRTLDVSSRQQANVVAESAVGRQAPFLRRVHESTRRTITQRPQADRVCPVYG